MPKAPFILLVNPWITDFAAYDLWAKPLGLLLLGALLRDGGCGIALVDCLDRHVPLVPAEHKVFSGVSRKYGTGKYPREQIAKPPQYDDIPRAYYRYGMQPETFLRRLHALPRPDLVWMTSIMTYWYPGIQTATALLREVWPDVPIWLGGIYAGLCPDHASGNSGASEIVALPTRMLPDRLEAATGYALSNRGAWSSLDSFPHPALDLLPSMEYAPILTSLGCPFNCPYCASHTLQPQWQRRGPDAIYDEVTHRHREYGIVDFAFYDDALLLGAEETLKPALQRICREGMALRFHTPNALHIRALTPRWCDLLYSSGFTTIRLGLETTRPERQKQWGGKVEEEMFVSAMEHLRSAGFKGTQIGVYLLCGLPGQSPDEVAEAISVVRDAGAQPLLAEYSPIPSTAMWREAVAVSSYDIEREPLYHNNTFFACRRPDFTCEDLAALKRLARQARGSTAECSDPAPVAGSRMPESIFSLDAPADMD